MFNTHNQGVHMKKHFTLTLLLLQLNAMAGTTLLGAINPDFEAVPYQELKYKIRLQAQNKGYLSIGESHLQADSARSINMDLINTYLEQTKKRQTIFCSEKIETFLDVYQKDIYKNVRKLKIFKGNSPNTTNFRDCIDKEKFENYVTYSGFFHQYQFAKAFKTEFPQSPVITKDGENILAQLSNLDGLFVTQLELEFMEFSASKTILNKGITDPKEFRTEVKILDQIISKLNASMETVLESENPFIAKKATIISAKDFTVELNDNNNSFFVLTNLGYRGDNDSLKALRKLIELDDNKLKNFLSKLKNSEKYITATFIGPYPNGEIGSANYPGLNRYFQAQSLIAHIKNETENYLLVMEPEADEFLCVDYKSAEEISCFEMIQ